MIEIDGVQYGKCAYCLFWHPIDEMRWDDNVLMWACLDAGCASFLVV